MISQATRLRDASVLGFSMLCLLTGCGGKVSKAPPQSGRADRAELNRRIDSVINEKITTGRTAGASVAVVRGTDTIAIRGYGLANIELSVPTPPHAIYEIGSITKQFTAAAVMQLVEQGKLKLDDDIRVYLPSYNSQGRKVSVRRLLDHTSGIKSYTEMPVFRAMMSARFPRDSLVTLFSKEPFDFEPGDEQIYNNSAFFLLGQIVAKVSGVPYEEYVQKYLFERADMKDAHYCSESAIHKNKATGYDADSTGLIQKRPLSHQWPYAAGSLCSSAIDLVRWNHALHETRAILNAESYKAMMTPGTLNDGTVLGYGKGIAVYSRLGHRTYHHGGGINGFLSEDLYFPDDSLSVVLLFNSARETPDATALKIAEFILGKPADAAVPIDGDASRFVGNYTGHGRGEAMQLAISQDGARVLAKADAFGDSAQALTYMGHDTFVLKETRLVFSGDGPRRTKVRIDSGYGNTLLSRK